MTKSPYLPVVAFAVMPSQAFESMPQTVPKREPIFWVVTFSEGTQESEATIDSQVAVLGVGGRASAAAQPPLPVTAGQARGLLADESVVEFIVVAVFTLPTVLIWLARDVKSLLGVTVVPLTLTRPKY